MDSAQIEMFNQILANFPILYPLKTLENQRFSGVFREYKMETLTKNGLNEVFMLSHGKELIVEKYFLGIY